MKRLTLDFVGRVKLQDVIGSAQGNVAKLTAMHAVYEKIRWTEEELKDLQITSRKDGSSMIAAPSAEFGHIEVEIEDAHANTILAEIEGWPLFSFPDLPLVARLKAQLTGECTDTPK